MRNQLSNLSDNELYELQNNVCKEIEDRRETRKEKIRQENLKFIGKTLVYKDGTGNTYYMIISDTCPQSSDCMKVNYLQVSDHRYSLEDRPVFEISTGFRNESVFDPNAKKKKIHYKYKEVSNNEFWVIVDGLLKRAREELGKTDAE